MKIPQTSLVTKEILFDRLGIPPILLRIALFTGILGLPLLISSHFRAYRVKPPFRKKNPKNVEEITHEGVALVTRPRITAGP